MAVRATKFKLEEEKISDIKNVADAFHMTMTDVVNAALDAYLAQKKRDPYYRLTCNADNACSEESEEILNALNALTDDDLKITR